MGIGAPDTFQPEQTGFVTRDSGLQRQHPSKTAPFKHSTPGRRAILC
ncbi:hypothetical protein EYF80_059780 [Liparis tanakae]|uniref:Uncharacterized protein n=1 Tax=Liparis tanakae TaxID=230148 RepID=A0A4Z2ENB1_9TELE|nr:hypothetical protein EYF80_059780 [Liparis tanakae]